VGERLDAALVSRGLLPTMERAAQEIRAGNVLVDERVVDKPGTPVVGGAAIRLRNEPARYVSRGGLKLEAALDAFGVSPMGRCCADFGASTGGFTDCLLQRGAARVYAIDVGYGQLAWSLRTDPRVVVMERTNVRHLAALPEAVELLVGDLSFISLATVLPRMFSVLGSAAEAVVLVKPQFEVGKEDIARGGLVRDEAARRSALDAVVGVAVSAGFALVGEMECPLAGARAGNREWLVHLRKEPC
jgi:23S rRNA (cytidine1920-2'-O)/16S rRNA (cytidine1409-2'-O)-methyltransferase